MRLFLAIELPEHVRGVLARLRERLAPDARGWRFLDPRAIHLTLRFLGEVSEEREPRLRPGWSEAARGCAPFSVRLEGLGTFPGPARPRVLWLGVHEPEGAPAGELAALAARLEQAARAAGFAPEVRPFRPHLTLARARPGERARAPALAEPEPAAVVECEEVVLFRSELSPAGARYTPLARFPLAAGPAGR